VLGDVEVLKAKPKPAQQLQSWAASSRSCAIPALAARRRRHPEPLRHFDAALDLRGRAEKTSTGARPAR